MLCTTCHAQIQPGWVFCQSCGTPVAAAPADPPPLAAGQPPPAVRPAVSAFPPFAGTFQGGGESASFGQRLGARIIDWVLWMVLVAALAGVWVGIANTPGTNILTEVRRQDAEGLIGALALLYVALVVGPFLYSWMCQGSKAGATIGQALLGLRTLRAIDEGRAGFGRAAGKVIVTDLGNVIFLLGGLSMLWNPERRTWGDRVSGTKVLPGNHARAGAVVGFALVAALVPGALVVASGFLAHNAISNSVTAAANSYGLGTDNGAPSSDNHPDVVPSDSSTTDPGTADSVIASPDNSDSAVSANVSSQGSEVNFRAGPGSQEYPVTTTGSDGENLTVFCQVDGESVDGANLWDYTSNGWINDGLVTFAGSLNACAGSVSSPTATTEAPDPMLGPFPVYRQGVDATVYNFPDTSSPATTLSDGTFVTIECTAAGPREEAPANYGGNSQWDRIGSPTSGWVPDAWINNHADTSDAPAC